MSNSTDEQQPEDTGAGTRQDRSEDSGEGITDDKLPEDLRPTDDNPLAKPMGEDEDEDSGEGAGPGPSAGAPDSGDPGAS